MDTKKISFGFSKIAKKPSLIPTNKGKDKEVPKVELIKCLEGQEIKLLEEKPVETPLIIPLKENTKTSSALASLIKRRAVLLGESDEPLAVEPECNVGPLVLDNESLEERAARELLASVQTNGSESVDQNLVVPAKTADELPLDGAKQSLIDDYENVPIEQFGKAMLRGMGWKEPVQKKGEPPADELPFVRPKGMGLGADKALRKQPLLIEPEKNEVLEIKKLAYVRLLGGKHKDMYGQIEGFDDHAGRVIVKMAIGGAKEAFNEFLCQPVSKKEFAQYGKCINSAKYEEYKKMENEHGQIIVKKDENIKNRQTYKEPSNLKSEYKKGNEMHKPGKSDNDKQAERIRNDERQRSDYESRSRRYGTDSHSSYSSTSNSRRTRHYELENDRSSSSRRERHNGNEKSKRFPNEHTSRYENERVNAASRSSSRRRQYTDDTSTSSSTDSGSDTAYERKNKKKSSHKTKTKKKSSKKAKNQHRHRTGTEESSDSDSEEDSYQHKKKKHKKKSKKSKKPRSRSRSHDRNTKR